MSPTVPSHPPAPLGAVLAITFLGSVGGGTFWASLFFVTARDYHFSPERNLLLASLMGVVYSAGALASGRLARGAVPRAVLVGALLVWAGASLLPVLLPQREGALWVSALVGSTASAVTFPIVESYLSAGRHGPGMRSAMGLFNVTWTPATALPLLLMPLFARVGLVWTFGLVAIANLAAVAVAFALPRRPGAHEALPATSSAGSEYPWLARSASFLLPASYVISATLAPVLPHRLAEVGITEAPSVVGALWMVGRFTTLLAMWRSGFWHGRWGTLAAAGVALASGLALVLLANTPATLVVGLVVYGVGMGLTYYAALYYSMAVGRAAIEAGGVFEALIGLGYFTGPLLGLAGHAVGPEHAGAVTVLCTWTVLALASRGAVLPYLAARRARAVGRER